MTASAWKKVAVVAWLELVVTCSRCEGLGKSTVVVLLLLLDWSGFLESKYFGPFPSDGEFRPLLEELLLFLCEGWRCC